MIDLHIHSVHSDGDLDIQYAISALLDNYSLASFADHEHIFNPSRYTLNNSTRYITGVELCCNANGVPIEILGYNFDPLDKELRKVIESIRARRRKIIVAILADNGIPVNKLPENPVRKSIDLSVFDLDPSTFWKSYSDVYHNTCHSLDVQSIMHCVFKAGGIPVLAHPMESFRGQSEESVENKIKAIGIETIELLTPKHSPLEVAMLDRIIARNRLSASIGSDSHGTCLNRTTVAYSLHDQKFSWIAKLL